MQSHDITGSRMFSSPRVNKLALRLAFLLCAVVALVASAFVGTRESNAFGFSRGGMSRGMPMRSFSPQRYSAPRAMPSMNRRSVPNMRSPDRYSRSARPMRDRYSRTAQPSRDRYGRRTTQPTRDRYGKTTQPTRDRYGRRATQTSNNHYRSASSAGSHKRAGSQPGNTHKRAGSQPGNTHARYGSEPGNTHKRAGSTPGNTHARYGSGTHARYGSNPNGNDHYRRGSSGPPRHARYSSFPRVVFTPPVPPPPPVYVGPPGPPYAGGSPPPPQAAGPRPIRRVFVPPPAGETNYVPDQVLVVLRDDLTEAQINQFLNQHRLARTQGGDRRNEILGERMFRLRITDGRSVPAVIAALQNDPRGVVAVPNFIYSLTQMTMQSRQPPVAPRARTSTGAYYSMQYIIAKLQLQRAHQITRGERVLVAVIDSGVDADHPELADTLYNVLDVTDGGDNTPHAHGTAMTGAIVAQSGLMGVAPGARVIAIRAFAPGSRNHAGGTTWHVKEAIYQAIRAGARVINLSLAGPADTQLAQAVEDARARGVVVVAAAGNNGPSAPAAYPAAYPGVIAVTAVDNRDRLYEHANRGNHIVIAAPGVDVFVIAPNGAYSMTTGTSIATAHVSGVIALMLSRNPMLDPEALRALLIRAARPVGGQPGVLTVGLADAFDAVAAAGGPQQPTVPVASGGQGPPTQ